jgi:hypothetical protein
MGSEAVQTTDEEGIRLRSDSLDAYLEVPVESHRLALSIGRELRSSSGLKGRGPFDGFR